MSKTAASNRNVERKSATVKNSTAGSQRFEPAKIDSLFVVLDAVAWLENPTNAKVAQFSGIDPRTAGKLLKNAVHIGLVTISGSTYSLLQPYPYKGTQEQKKDVVKEALVRHPLLTSVRQFLRLGDKKEVALRKAATVSGILPFVAADLNPLLEWASSLGALEPDLITEDLVDAAENRKMQRHKLESEKRVAFLSHSSVDKPFIRQLAADLTANGINVWLDEQKIRVGESIPERVAQGLAESDFFLVAISENSIASQWVQKELNNALVNEVQRRKVHILPLKLDGASVPQIIADKRYADFSLSYKTGLDDLVAALKGDL